MRYQDKMVYLGLELESVHDDYAEERISGDEARRRIEIIKTEHRRLNDEIAAAGFAIPLGSPSDDLADFLVKGPGDEIKNMKTGKTFP